MIALYFVIATLIWLYIGYISALIIFKIIKEDIFESYNFSGYLLLVALLHLF